jgi:acetylcholinesterase
VSKKPGSALKNIGNISSTIRSVNVAPESDAAGIVGDDIKKFYFGDEGVSKKTVPQLIELLTDYHFELGQYLTVELHSRYQHKSPLYFYQFCYEGGLNLYKKIFNLNKFKGACHADEMYYMFS